MFPADLVDYDMWKRGPKWLREPEDHWNKRGSFDEHPIPVEEREVRRVLLPVVTFDLPLLERTSSYDHLARITAWILRFTNNARKRVKRITTPSLLLTRSKEPRNSGGESHKEPLSKGNPT